MENAENKGNTRFVKGAAILAAAGILSRLIGVLFRVWAYDILGEAGMDFYEIVFPFYSWLLIISSSGIPAAISRLVAERVALGDHAGARKVFIKSLWLMVGIGLATTAVLFFGAGWFATALAQRPPEYAIAFRALAPALFFVSLLCAYRGYLQGVQRMSGTGLSQIAEQVFKVVFALILARLWLPRGIAWAAAGVLVGVVISEALALGIMMIFTAMNRHVLMPSGASRVPQNGGRVIGPMLAIAVPITLGASVLPLAGVADVWLINSNLAAYMTQEAVKQSYVVLSTNVRSLINLPAGITVALAMSLVPAIAAARARKDEAGLKNASLLGLKLSMAVGLPCTVGLFVLGGPIIQMLFPRIPPESLALATDLMRLASLTVVFISMAQTATGALQGLGRQWLPVLFMLIGAALKILSSAILLRIPAVNIFGAPISNIICFGVAGILDTIFLAHYAGLKLNVWDVFGKPLLGSALMGGILYFGYKLLYALRPGSMMALVATLLGIAIYLVLVFALQMFKKTELALIPGGRKLSRFAKE